MQLLRAKDLGNDKVLVKSRAVVVSLGVSPLGVSPAGLPAPHKKLIWGGQRLLRGREGLSQTGSQLPPSEQPRGRASAQAPRSAPAPRAAPGREDTPRQRPAGSPGESPAQAAAERSRVEITTGRPCQAVGGLHVVSSSEHLKLDLFFSFSPYQNMAEWLIHQHQLDFFFLSLWKTLPQRYRQKSAAPPSPWHT